MAPTFKTKGLKQRVCKRNSLKPKILSLISKTKHMNMWTCDSRMFTNTATAEIIIITVKVCVLKLGLCHSQTKHKVLSHHTNPNPVSVFSVREE